MFARLLYKSLTVRRSRVAVAVASIMVGAAVVSALTLLYFDISSKMSKELRTFGANFFIGAAPAQADRGLDDQTYARVVDAIPHTALTGVSRYLYGVVRLDLGNAVLAGVDFAGLRAIAPYWQVEGKWIGVAFDERHCMIGRRIAETMELAVGDTVTVVNRDHSFQTRLVVKGIMETGEAEDEQVFVNLSLARKLLDAPDRSDFAMASIVAQGADADALADRINRAFPEVDAKPIRKISQSDGRILDKIDGFMALVAGIILVMTSLCVDTTLTAMVVERSAEIGLQKAIGADDRAIVVQFLAETLVICLVGVGLGLALGVGLAQVLGQTVFNAWVSFRAIVVPLTFGASLAAAAAAAAVPIRGATGVVPARVLKGE